MRRLTLPFACALLLASLPPPAGAQPDGAALVREANALARSGLYRAALLRYTDARAAGYDGALLHFNLGVVYYHMERYDEAVAAFERAAGDPALASLARYNLGLAHRAAGRPTQALESFRRLSSQGSRLSTLAQSAAAATVEEPPARRAGQPTRRDSPPIGVRRDGPAGELHLSLTAGYGYVDNVYRTREEPYVDLARPGQPLIEPQIEAAGYYPVDFDVRYVLHNEAGDTDFVIGYLVELDYYQQSYYGNADTATQRAEVGADIVLGERERRRRTLQPMFFVVKHHEMNYDQEDGFDREIGEHDIGLRFAYLSAGLESEFAHTLGPWHWSFDLRLERRDYADVTLVAQYDHELHFGQAGAAYSFNEATSLRVGLRRYRRTYDQRPARDLDGVLLSTHPTLTYDYTGYQVGVTRRVGRVLEIDFDVLRLERADTFVGYHDYTRDTARLSLAMRAGERFSLAIAAAASRYDYANAFAFNDPSAGARELDTVDGEIEAEFRVNRSLSIWAEARLRSVTSTDPRAEYDRTSTMLGVRWRR